MAGSMASAAGDLIAAAAGASLEHRLRGDSHVVGTPPDCASLTDISPGADGTYDFVQSTETRRAHISTSADGSPSFQFDEAGQQQMRFTGASPDQLDAGDTATAIVAASFTTIAANGGTWWRFHNAAFSSRLQMTPTNATDWQVQLYTVSRGVLVLTKLSAGVGTSNMHILRMSLKSDRGEFAVDGNVTASSVSATGGLALATTSCEIQCATGTSKFDGAEWVMLRNPTDAQIVNTEQAMADQYGVTL